MPRSDTPGGKTDPVAERLRAAGPRPPLPPFDIEGLAAPALAAWQEKIARKRQRHRVYWALAAAVLVVVLAVFQRSVPPGPVATVLAYTGPAPERFDVGSGLDVGTVLRTDALHAEWLTVSFDGHVLRLDSGSELRLESASWIELLRGAVYVDTSKAPLTVHAAGIATEPLGTRFEVSLLGEGEVAVRVRDGQVRVRSDRHSVEVRRGQQALGSAAVGFSVSASPPWGDSWSWIRRAAPPFDSDGADLETVLAWLAGEAGWQLEIDPALYADTSGQPARMRGSIDRLGLDEALAAVLESAGLHYRFDGDRLIIEEPQLP